MYDLDGDDRISKEELLAVLTMMVGANISEDQLISIAERTIMEADTDKDNLISFDEFKTVSIIRKLKKPNMSSNIILFTNKFIKSFDISGIGAH
jgi:Ca2+-binding EF-hand superfamily protein